jgi:hypothetical protein
MEKNGDEGCSPPEFPRWETTKIGGGAYQSKAIGALATGRKL